MTPGVGFEPTRARRAHRLTGLLKGLQACALVRSAIPASALNKIVVDDILRFLGSGLQLHPVEPVGYEVVSVCPVQLVSEAPRPHRCQLSGFMVMRPE